MGFFRFEEKYCFFMRNHFAQIDFFSKCHLEVNAIIHPNYPNIQNFRIIICHHIIDLSNE